MLDASLSPTSVTLARNEHSLAKTNTQKQIERITTRRKFIGETLKAVLAIQRQIARTRSTNVAKLAELKEKFTRLTGEKLI
jgi:hypothetical protein